MISFVEVLPVSVFQALRSSHRRLWGSYFFLFFETWHLARHLRLTPFEHLWCAVQDWLKLCETYRVLVGVVAAMTWVSRMV